MIDYDHDGKIDKNDFVIEEMMNEEHEEREHSDFISSIKGLGLVMLGLLLLYGIIKAIGVDTSWLRRVEYHKVPFTICSTHILFHG